MSAGSRRLPRLEELGGLGVPAIEALRFTSANCERRRGGRAAGFVSMPRDAMAEEQ